MYWISIENSDKNSAKIAKAVECPVLYNSAGGKLIVRLLEGRALWDEICYARHFGDCAGGRSKEHYVSESVLEVAGSAIQISGFPSRLET